MKNHLERALGPWQAASIVVGSVIGSGIFLKTSTMAQQLGSMSLVLLAWLLAGALSFAGALTYAELAARLPKSGGEYVILRETYNSCWAFLYGWMRFWIGAPGSIAAYAVGAATFLQALLNSGTGDSLLINSKFVAVSSIFVFTAINCLQVRWGARVQTFLTALKVVLVLFLAAGIIIVGKVSGASEAVAQSPIEFAGAGSFLSAFGLAMIAALWAYDGWNNLPMISEEIRTPQKNIPIALGIGMALCGVLYVLANVSYFSVLSIGEIQQANSSLHPQALPVATLAARSFLHDWGVPFLSLAFVISALGAMNGSILTGARVPYAMAKDGLFWRKLGKIEAGSNVPVWSVAVQGAWSMVLALSGTFDQLTDYVVVASWIFYGLVTAAIFKLRKAKGQTKIDFLVPGYPWVPLLFIVSAFGLVLNSIIKNPMQGAVGLLLILLGLPVYYWMQNNAAK